MTAEAAEAGYDYGGEYDFRYVYGCGGDDG